MATGSGEVFRRNMPSLRVCVLGLHLTNWQSVGSSVASQQQLCSFMQRVLRTSAGKSVCYQILPAVTGRVCIVISPLISLMQDQVQRRTALM